MSVTHAHLIIYYFKGHVSALHTVCVIGGTLVNDYNEHFSSFSNKLGLMSNLQSTGFCRNIWVTPALVLWYTYIGGICMSGTQGTQRLCSYCEIYLYSPQSLFMFKGCLESVLFDCASENLAKTPVWKNLLSSSKFQEELALLCLFFPDSLIP